MLSESIKQALNFTLNGEITNAYRYKMFSAIADYQSLTGAAKWFGNQWKEETEHFEIFFKYTCDSGMIPSLLTVPEQFPEVISLEEMFRRTVEFEFETTFHLKQFASICKLENDDQTYKVVLDILQEQVEEEKTAKEIFDRIQMSRNNMLLVDHELGQRADVKFMKLYPKVKSYPKNKFDLCTVVS